MNGIPEKINMFNAYSNGSKLIGLTEEVKLPDFEVSTETISGPGILGEIDSPSIGQFSGQELEIPFRNLYDDIFSLMNPLSAVDLTLRGSLQILDGQGNISFVGMRVAVRGRFKGLTGGSVKQGSPTNSSVKIELTYILIEINGQSKIELDKLNAVYKVNGVDVIQKARSLC